MSYYLFINIINVMKQIEEKKNCCLRIQRIIVRYSLNFCRPKLFLSDVGIRYTSR